MGSSLIHIWQTPPKYNMNSSLMTNSSHIPLDGHQIDQLPLPWAMKPSDLNSSINWCACFPSDSWMFFCQGWALWETNTRGHKLVTYDTGKWFNGMCAKAAVSGRGEITHPPISKIFYAPTRNNSDALYTWCRNHQKAFCTCMRVYEITHYLHKHLQLSFSLSSQVLLAVELFCDWTLKSTGFRERKLWAPFLGLMVIELVSGFLVFEWLFSGVLFFLGFSFSFWVVVVLRRKLGFELVREKYGGCLDCGYWVLSCCFPLCM